MQGTRGGFIRCGCADLPLLSVSGGEIRAARRRLSNAGIWPLGRLQTDADRARVLDGLGEDEKKSMVAKLLKKIGPTFFLVRGARGELSVLQPAGRVAAEGPDDDREIERASAPRRAT